MLTLRKEKGLLDSKNWSESEKHRIGVPLASAICTFSAYSLQGKPWTLQNSPFYSEIAEKCASLVFWKIKHPLKKFN